MTTQEMRDELAASLGNRTDITDARYVQWLNWALLDLCGLHRRRAFPPKRFRILEQKLTFSSTVVSGTVASATASTLVLVAGDVEISDYYNDWVLEITAYDEAGAGTDTPDGLIGQKRVVFDYDFATNTITIAEDWDTTPDAYTTYSIYQRIYDLNDDLGVDPAETLWAIQRMENFNTGVAITHKEWREVVGLDYRNTGEPVTFARRSNSIIFDVTPDETIYYRVWYYRFPTRLSTAAMDTECEIPDYWHEVIVLGALYRGHAKLMEPERADAAYEVYQKEAAYRQDSYTIESKQREEGLKMRME